MSSPRRNGVATLDLTSGRANQKAKTRASLVQAAIALVGEEKTFTVADVADLAGVSRATAYNYFPTLDGLYAQAVLTFVSQFDEPDFAKKFSRTHDVGERAKMVVEASDTLVCDFEAQYRAMLRESLSSPSRQDVPPRPRYRTQWLEAAVAPLRHRLGKRGVQRLATTLSLTIGIEAHVTLRDVCRVSAAEARRVKLAAAEAIVQAALAAPTSRPRHAGRTS
jgi:AcrR family transcriptional regulator